MWVYELRDVDTCEEPDNSPEIPRQSPDNSPEKEVPSSSALKEYCERENIARCDQNDAFKNVIFVGPMDDDIKKTISDGICLLSPTAKVNKQK